MGLVLGGQSSGSGDCPPTEIKEVAMYSLPLTVRSSSLLKFRRSSVVWREVAVVGMSRHEASRRGMV